MGFFYRLPRTVAELYKGKNIVWQLIAAGATYAIVATGFDWLYFEHTRNIPFAVVLPAVAIGGLLPIILPLCLAAWGTIRKNDAVRKAGFALGQAALLAFLISSFYKAFTGRIPPPDAIQDTVTKVGQAAVDLSHGFQFGFLRGGVFWGWPSSHTAVAFAMGGALFALFPEKKRLRWIGFLWALYVGISVSVSIHWFSEFVAGAIIGSVIGITVGRSLRNMP